jgi:hypothetical protein
VQLLAKIKKTKNYFLMRFNDLNSNITMKKIRLIIVFIFFGESLLLSQTKVNIDSLYQVFYNTTEYNEFLRVKLFTMNSEWEDGYIVSLKGDTIYGQIKLHESGIHASVKNANMEKKFRADKYLTLKYGGRKFVSKKLDQYSVNAELLDSGKINFYAYEQIYKSGSLAGYRPQHITLFYMEKNNIIYGPFYSSWEDFTDGFSLLSECINDYNELLIKVKNKEFKYSDLWIIIKIYNYWYNINFR